MIKSFAFDFAQLRISTRPILNEIWSDRGAADVIRGKESSVGVSLSFCDQKVWKIVENLGDTKSKLKDSKIPRSTEIKPRIDMQIRNLFSSNRVKFVGFCLRSTKTIP